jgi:hypothetical protein
VSRQERQQEEIMSALSSCQFARVLVLSREHLAEFPDDVDVKSAADQARRHRRHHTSSGDA